MPHDENRFPKHQRNNDPLTRATEEIAEGISDLNDTLREALLKRTKPNSLNGQVVAIYGRKQ